MSWNALSKEITVIVAGLFIALTSYLLVKMGIIITSIAWLICTAYLLAVACIYIYRRIKHIESIKNNLSFEIDQILKKLQDFWQDYQKNSGRSWKHGGIVINTNPFTPTLVQFKCVFPKLHQEVLKDSEPIKVREFYYKIEDIECIYEELRSNRAKDFKIVKQWEALVSDILKQGNPLKTT